MNSMTRVALFIDGANLFYLQKNRLGWFIDPSKLLTWVKKQGRVVDAFYYSGFDPNDTKVRSFLTALGYMGYTLITKPIKVYNNTSQDAQEAHPHKVMKASLDTEIVLDMFNTLDLYDMAVLVSGDSDFERALQLLRARGKDFLVLSTDGHVAREIREVAGMRYVDIQTLRSEIEKEAKE